MKKIKLRQIVKKNFNLEKNSKRKKLQIIHLIYIYLLVLIEFLGGRKE